MAKKETKEEAEARAKEWAEKKAKKCMIFYSGRDPVQPERPEGEGAIHLLPRSQKEVTEADLDTLKKAKVDFVQVPSRSDPSPFVSDGEKLDRQPPSSGKSLVVGEEETSESDSPQSLFRSKGRTKKKK